MQMSWFTILQKKKLQKQIYDNKHTEHYYNHKNKKNVSIQGMYPD